MKTLLMLAVLLTALTSTKAQAQMDTDQKLTSRQQHFVQISALTATGDLENLKVQLKSSLDDGLTISEVKEILVQLYAYCGFPRSLNSLNTFMAVLEKRKAKGINDPEGKTATPIKVTDKYQTGKKNLQVLTGREETTLSGANAFAPAIDTFLKEHLFADIFERDVLSFQDRELITVAALAAMNGVAPQLQAHIGMAMNTGLTQANFTQAFGLIDQTVGKSQGDLARKTLQTVIEGKK